MNINKKHAWSVSAAVVTFACSAAANAGGSTWGEAEPVQRSDETQVPGGCPIESPAGNFLFTARPGGGLDIYANQRDESGESFSPGSALPSPANDPTANDFCPTPRPDGELYFVSDRAGSCGGGPADIHHAINHPATGWSEPQNLGCEPAGPNTPGLEFSPSIVETKWGTFLFFSSNYHTGNQDIYVSRQRKDGTFGPGWRLGYPINTEYNDQQPNVSQDGREIVFASDRPSSPDDESGFDIFYAKRHAIFTSWRRVKNLSESVPFETVDGGETRPSLSFDGERLYYGSGGVWISERKRKNGRWGD